MTKHTRDHATKHGVSEEDDIHGYIDHGSIQGLSDDDHAQYLRTDGTRTLTGNLSAGGFKITNVGTPTSPNDVAGKDYVDSKAQGLEWQDSVEDKDVTDPSTLSPSIGERWIIGIGAIGVWSGKDNQIAEWDGSTWIYTVPNEGFATWVEDEDVIYVYNGTVWVKIGGTVDHGNLNGLGDDDHTQYSRVDSTRPFTNPIGGVSPTLDSHLTTKGWVNTLAEIQKIKVITQTTEPAVPAGEVRIWVDSDAPEPQKYWLIYGTDGTVGGNKSVNLT